MLTKEKLKEQIEKFPDEFTIDELIEKLILIEKIETGDKQSENGEVISEKEMENEIDILTIHHSSRDLTRRNI